MSAKNNDNHNRFRSQTIAFRVSPEEDKQINIAVSLSGMTKQDYITYKLLDRTINVKASCKVHRAVYDRLTEVLEQLKRLNDGREIDDELMDNISLITRLVDGLYMEYRRNAGNIFFRRCFPSDLPVCAIVPQGIVGRGRYATINCVFRQGLKHLQAVAAIDFVRFYPHADTSPGLVVMTRYSSVSCGKRSIKGKITLP